jgi:hypothetical protein
MSLNTFKKSNLVPYVADFFLSGRIFPPDWPESFAKNWQHCVRRCAGDGDTLISLQLVLATNARFLASEVKPIQPPEPTLQPPEPPERPRQPPKHSDTQVPVSPAPKKPFKAAAAMSKGQKGKKLPSRVASPLEFRFVF